MPPFSESARHFISELPHRITKLAGGVILAGAALKVLGQEPSFSNALSGMGGSWLYLSDDLYLKDMVDLLRQGSSASDRLSPHNHDIRRAGLGMIALGLGGAGHEVWAMARNLSVGVQDIWPWIVTSIPLVAGDRLLESVRSSNENSN